MDMVSFQVRGPIAGVAGPVRKNGRVVVVLQVRKRGYRWGCDLVGARSG